MPGIKGYDHDGGVQPHQHVPDEKTKATVIGFCCAGFTREEIASYFEMSLETLYKYYRVELTQSKMDKLKKVSNKAFRLALRGNTKMIELILRTQGKWVNAKAPEEEAKDKQQATLIEKLIDKL